jgi:hypothetical protein
MSAAELKEKIDHLAPAQLEQVAALIDEMQRESERRMETIRELQAMFQGSSRTLADFLSEKHAAGENW